MVLKGHHWEGCADIAIEPELKGDIHGLCLVGIALEIVCVATVVATDHFVHSVAMFSLTGEFVPDVEPLAEVFVDDGTTNDECHGLDGGVPDRVAPSDAVATTMFGTSKELGPGESREMEMEPHLPEKIAAAGDCGLK